MLLHANALALTALMRVTLRGFPGFDQSAGLSFGLMGLGLGLGAGLSIRVGGDTEAALVWKLMLPLTQSIDGL